MVIIMVFYSLGTDILDKNNSKTRCVPWLKNVTSQYLLFLYKNIHLFTYIILHSSQVTLLDERHGR